MSQSIIKQMEQNSAAWHGADQNERKRLEGENQKLGSQVGGSYNASAGTWSNSSGGSLYQPKNSTVSLSPSVDNTPNQFGYANGSKVNNRNEDNSDNYLGAVNRTLGKDNNYGFSDDSLSYLKGRGSGKTFNDQGFENYYTKTVERAQAGLDWYNKSGDDRVDYKQALDMQLDTANKSFGQYDEFANWDTGLFDVYVQNKRKAEQSKDPEEVKRLAAINQQLRDFYDMKEDKWNSGDLGQIAADNMFGNLLQYGLSKEENYKDIPAIGTTDDNYDPRFEAARMMARSNDMLGYGALGYMVDEDGSMETARHHSMMQQQSDMKAFNAREIAKQELPGQIDNFIKSNGGQINGKTEVKSIMTLDGNQDESIIHTSNGYFVKSEGKMMEIDEDQYTNMMLELNGFDTSTPYSSKQTPKSDVSSGINTSINPSTNPTINNSTTNKGVSNVPVSPRDTQTNILFQSNKARTFAENNPEHVAKITPFVDNARSMLGSIYSQPKRMKDGYADCSSLVGRAMKMAGLTDDSFVTTATMITDNRFQYISKAEAMPGDIMWEKGHVGILLDNGKVLEASGSKGKVVEQNLGKRFTGAYRIKT